MFQPLGKAVQQRAANLMKDATLLYQLNLSKDALWDAYLRGFPNETVRQEHVCNTCKSFIRQFGHVGVIKDGKFQSFLDVDSKEIPAKYVKSMQNMLGLIEAATIRGTYFTTEAKYGIEFNRATLESVEEIADLIVTHYLPSIRTTTPSSRKKSRNRRSTYRGKLKKGLGIA